MAAFSHTRAGVGAVTEGSMLTRLLLVFHRWRIVLRSSCHAWPLHAALAALARCMRDRMGGEEPSRGVGASSIALRAASAAAAGAGSTDEALTVACLAVAACLEDDFSADWGFLPDAGALVGEGGAAKDRAS